MPPTRFIPKGRGSRSRILALACVAVVAGILVAGLWPFSSPKNQVSWRTKSGGLWFGGHGTALSVALFEPASKPEVRSCTVEIWLTPALTWEHRTILAFYAPNRTIRFSLHQSNRDLLIEGQQSNPKPNGVAAKLYVNRVFQRDRTVYITVTSDGRETAVYVDGALAVRSRELVFSEKDLVGELVVANSPVFNDSWSGTLKGLDFYNAFLTQKVTRQHYQYWTSGDMHSLAGAGKLVGLYVFDQAAGRTVRDQIGKMPDLYIPKQYMLFDHMFLQRPWDEYMRDRNYGKSALLNVAGFVPLGFIIFAYLFSLDPGRRAGLLTILIGAAVSVTIEVLQSFLPTRDSGMTDIITNTLGTAIGVGLYYWIKLSLERFGRNWHSNLWEFVIWLTYGTEGRGSSLE